MAEISRKIKSFVRRGGRMTGGQALAYNSMMPKYGIEFVKKTINFSQLFGNDAPVVLEIGFGMGASLAEQAAKNPHLNFFGIEVHRPGIGALMLRVQEQGLTNIRTICHDAIDVLEQMINDASLSRVQLYFPDPWHKTRHNKRRIVKPEFVQLLHHKIQVEGIYHMATDWEDYAKHMLKVMGQEKNWRNLSETNNYIARPEERPMTKFEKRGERLGHGVWDLMFTKII